MSFVVSPVGDCQTLETIIGWGLVAGTATTTLLFFIRVRAIFIGSKWVIRFFALLWLANLGAVIAVPFALSSAHIGPTSFCMNTGVKSWTAVTLIITAINDTLVFAFVSYVLITTTTSTPPGIKNAAKAFFMGKDLPEISRVLLQGGQQYYLYVLIHMFFTPLNSISSMTVGVNVFTMVLKVIPSVPPIYRAMFSSPNLALENSMACRVYRNIKFGISRDPPIPSLNPPHNSNSNSNTGRSRSRSNTVSASLEHKYTRRLGGQRTRNGPRFDAVDELGVETFTLQPSAFGKGRGRPMERSHTGSGVKIEVTRTIERDDDRSDYDLDPTKLANLGDSDV